MQPTLHVLAFIAGILLTIQVGANSTLRSALGAPVTAALVNFLVGLVGLALYLIVSRTSLPGRAELVAVPGWAWLGGFLGAFYVATAIVVGPRLGAATLLALTVLGQLLASLLLDNFGWLGFPQHPLSLARLLGALLLFSGVVLMTR